MMFQVDVQKNENILGDIKVEAESQEEAEKKVRDMIENDKEEVDQKISWFYEDIEKDITVTGSFKFE